MPFVDYEQQKTFWEGAKKRRSPAHPAVLAFAKPKLDYILSHLPRKDGTRSMLEVGAGNGYFSHTFNEAFELTSLDFSKNMLDMNPLPWDQKVVGDAEHLPFDDNSFDIVFCGNLLHHLEDPVIAVREMKRVAREHVILIEPNVQNPLMFAFGLLKREEWGSLKFNSLYMKWLGKRAGLNLRAYDAQGSIVPNKTPQPAISLLKHLDRTGPVGFYHIAIFDV
jgi:ubiquinone/menaquinone biosynthesis C-methylase UbiE